MAIDVERTRRLFTVEEYEKMVETGILGEDDRVELIEGEIVEMSPIGDAHAAVVANLTHLLVGLVGQHARVWVQAPVRLLPLSKPQPDLALLRLRSYMREGASKDDAMLFIEVADTTLRYDRTVKLRLYARAGISEYWIVDTNAETVEVFRSPAVERYAEVRRFARGESIAPLCLPDASIPVDQIFV